MAVSGNGDWPLKSPRATAQRLHRKQAAFGVETIRHTLLVDLFFGSAVVVLSGTVAATTDDVTTDAAGKVWVKGPAAFTADDVSIAAAGTVSAGPVTRTGTVAITTADLTHVADGNNIPPPGSFPVTDDYRLRKNIQPIPRMAVVHRGTMAGRVAWWNRR